MAGMNPQKLIPGGDAPEPAVFGLTIQHGLAAFCRHLDISTALVLEFEGGEAWIRDILTDVAGVRAGSRCSLDGFDLTILAKGDAVQTVPAALLALPGVRDGLEPDEEGRAAVGVPVMLADGRLYGLFCCIGNLRPAKVTAREFRMMRVFADMVAHRVDSRLAAERLLAERRARIRSVIADSAFRVVYQPIWDFSLTRPVGFECLCRFDAEPRRSPDAWFNDALEIGEAIPLELAVVRKALLGASTLPRDVYVSINASPQLIVSGHLHTLLAEFPAIKIVVEVTEHTQIADYEDLRDALVRLRAQGVDFAVDDAGAGYSSLKHIVQLRPDIIKLDIGLTRAVDTDTARRALVSALIYFARETGSLMIAEGIETEGERDILKLLGISRGQGYLMGRPMDLADAASLFIDQSDIRVA
jgi:EAL domain-containing protein (putative c-di-GMP-specific phosphodiesterase class I)